MNPKIQTFAQLATNTSGQLTGSYAEWTHFLETAARLYKYPYHEQVLIYAQRPEATACASYDVWNKRMGRGVRRGSKGIGLLSADGVRYVFDISDTFGRDGSRKPYLWEYREEHTEAVTAALADKYGVTDEGGLPYQLEAIALELAGEYWEQNWEDILASVPGSFLEDYDELNVEVEFRNAATVSTTYALMSRCGLNPADFFSHEDFLPVFDFNTPDSITALGTAVSGNSEQVLRQIEVTIKNYERTRRMERRGLYGEQPDLPAGGGLPAARIRDGNTIDFGEIRTDEGAVSEGGAPGTVQPADSQRETGSTPDRDRPDSRSEVGIADAGAEEVHGPDGTVEGPGSHEVGGPNEQREGESGGDDTGRADLPVTAPSAIDFAAVGPTGLQFSHRELDPTVVPYFEDVSEKRELLIKSDALKKRQVDVAEYFASHSASDERVQFVKSLFNNTYTEIILDSGQRVGYRAYDDVLHLWRGPYTDREQEEYLRWEDTVSAIEGMMQDGLWVAQAKPLEQLTLEIGEPEKVTQDEEYIPNLFDLAGSTIPLTSEPGESTATVRPGLSQNVIDAALTLGANDPDSRLRIIAEFMKDKPLEENARFLQAHYKENGAGFYIGERKYSLWYNEAGMQIAPGESALTFTATALTWEQAADRIRELLDEGRYASQSMLYRAWPFEKNRVAEALQYLHRDIDEEYKDKYLPALTAAIGGAYIYPDVVDKTKELLEQPEQLKDVIDEFVIFQRDYAHNRDILRFHSHRTDEIMQGLQDLQRSPLKFTASPDYTPVERFFISQDEIDDLLREGNDRNDYRIKVYNFFEQHPDRKEREKYLSHLHGEYSGYHGGNDNITYTHKELTFTHGDIMEPYASVKMKWSQVRKRIEELIQKDKFLSTEDREVMENRTLEVPAEEPSAPISEPEPISAEDAKKHDILMANTKAHFASYEEVKKAHPGDIVLFQRGDFFEMYGPDARVASVELDIHLINRNIPELGRVAMCSVTANDLERCVEILRKEHDVTISAVPGNGAERETYSLSKHESELDIAKKIIQDFCMDEYGGDADFSDLEHVSLAYTTTEDGEQEIQVEADLVHFVLTKYLSGQVCDEYHYNSLQELTEAELTGMNFDELVTLEVDVQSITPRYRVTAYHPTENGFDAKLDYHTQAEAEKIARDYVAGRMDEDGFQYEGAAVFDLQERQWLYVAGHFPVLDGEELPYLPYKLGDKSAKAQQDQPPTVRELYEKYKAEIITALGNDQLYRNACQNSDKENAYIEGGAAIKRAVLAAGDDTLAKLYFDNNRFHNDLHREALDETYPLFSQPGQALSEQVQPEQDSDTSARKELTELQKKAIEIAKRYEKLPMEERLSVIAHAFGCKTGKIETSPCTGKWRGTSDISIRFDNGVSLFIGNSRTQQAKTARVQNEYVNSALVSYNPEIVSLTKEAALPILRKREAIDNEIAAQKGLKPYTLLNVELNITPSEWNGGYLGWYYVTLAVEGKICTHMETDLYYDIADGKVNETPTRDKFFPAGALKDTDIDYVFDNVGFSSTSSLYSLPISDEVRERAEKTLAEREMQAGIGRSKAAEEEKSRLFVEHVMEDVEQLAEQEPAPTVRELYEHYKEILWGKLMEDEAFQNACLNSDRQNAMDEGHNAVERAAKDLGIAQGDMQFYKLYYGNTPFHNRMKEELANEGYDAYIAMSAELPPWGVEVGNHSPWGIVQTTQELADGVFKVSTPSHGGIMLGETLAKEYLPPELLARGGTENGWCFFEEDELAPQVVDELTQKGLVTDPNRETSLPNSITSHSKPEEKRSGQTRPERNYRSFARLFPEIADGSYHYLRMESGAGMGGMMPLHVEWISDDTVSISHTYTQNGDLMYDPEMTFLIDRDKGTMEAASYQQDSLGIYQNVYPEPGRWVPKLRKDLNNFAQQWLKNISEQNYVKREAIVVENGEDVTLEFDSEGALIQPKQLPDEPRDPLAPAYKVGDTVHLDDKEFTITEIGLHDVYLQSLTPAEQISRSKDKTIFENLLRRDERNKYITDFFSADLEWSNGDLCEVLTSEYGFFSQEEKDEISSWLRSGETNSQISEKMREQFSYRSDSMELSDVRADHDSSGDGLTIFLVDSAPNEDEEYPKEIISASWDEITEIVRAMYKQELGGFHHETPAQEITPDTSQHDAPAPQDSSTPTSPQTWTEPVAIYPAEKNNLPFDVVIETLHIEEPQRGPKPQNFHITDDNLGAGGAKSKYQMNIAALRTLQKIESENRTATPEEQDILSKYVGWGALADAFDEGKPDWTTEYKELRETLTLEEYESARASTLNAHYTSPTVIKAIYQALENMGFKGGNILEPSCGVGNFFGLLPDSMSESRLYGVELDGLTGRIAKQLYPHAHIEIKGYENTNFQNNSFDLAIGNVPFGQYKVFDPAYNKLGFSIHNYFFAKAIDQVRPGGIVAFVTSRYTMDSKATEAREYMAQRAELLGAIRLPNNAFLSNAGTEVVSDILFLQKREQPITELPDWVQTGENKDGYTINSYFVRHPEMILGEQSSDSTQYGRQDFTVKPIPGVDLGEQLREAITHIEGQYVEAETVSLEEETEQETIPADPEVKNFSYTIIKGDIYYRQDSVMVKTELGATAKARTTALIDLRDCTRRLIAEQMELSTKDEDIHSTQAELNRLYDIFAAKFGRINDKTNERAFSDDSSYYLLCALEILDDDGKFVRKADMFTKRTILPRQEITHVDTATEALEVSIGERARVDISFMAGLTGKTEEEIINELQGQIFRVPFRDPPVYQTADEYLSGNVREKLNVAEVAAEDDPAFNINVNALAAVQPKDLDASEISVRLGTDWIDPEYVEQFMYELLKTPGYAREYIHVQYSSTIHAWNISSKRLIRENDVTAYTTYGTKRVSAYKLLEDALNLQNTRVFDTKTVNGEDKRELNAKETTLAQQKQDMIKYAFQDWIWKDPDRRQKLVRKYNDEMNCIRPRQYDGSHLVLAGMNPEIQLEEHQKNAIARAVYGGNTLFAHCVGAGKTFEITASAMEMKRLGLCSKSMIVVPNHITGQWASEFLRLYPNANILVTTKRDFEKDRRKKFCSRIATGDYDAVIIGYSQFEKIPISKERQIMQLNQQMDAIIDGIARAKEEDGQRFTVKSMERTKRSLEARLKKLRADNRKDTVIDFEELGIDRLFVDEADSYKNLFLVTKMQNVAGLSTSDAQKSSDMFSKTQYLDEITDYKGVIFATGTPISNSITEMYTVQRYLQSNALQAMGMEHFDSWASRFGETTTTMELAPEGTGYRPRTRFAKFFNLPELMNIFHEVADIKTEDMLNLPTPDVEFHNIVAKPTEFQREYVRDLSKRATDVRKGNVKPTEDNMLKITNDGRKLGLDQRLINPLAEDDPTSKLNLCVENIMRFWEDGRDDKLTQLVFCDLSTPKKGGSFNVYDDIKRKLMERGVPESEVAFIHDADTEVKKKELFGKVRSGKVRVLIGSTQKLGAGTNIQDRLIALHHLDVPWRPRDLTQREGRIKRRGNQNDIVHVFRYVTEGTFDSYLYQTVEKKQQFIGQIMTSKSPARTCEDVDEAALSYAEVKALCAGDPRIKERMELDVEVAKLQVMQASHRSQQYDLEDKIRLYFPQEQQRLEWRIEGIERDMAALAENPLPVDGYIGIELLGQHFGERKKAGVVLLNELKNVKTYTMSKVGEYRGLEVHVKRQNLLSEPQIIMKGAVEYSFTASDSDIGNITRIDNALERLPEELAKAQASLENVKQQFESAKQAVGKPFPQEQELKDKLARITELDIALKMADDSPQEQPYEPVTSQEHVEDVEL